MSEGMGLIRNACLALCTVLVLAASGGCSFMFVKGPPPMHEKAPYFECTTSRGWPVVDTVLASVYAIQTAAFIGSASGSDSSESGMQAGAAGSALAAALFTASAMSGYGKASDCRKAIQALQLRLMRMQPGPGPWSPGAYPYPYYPYPPPAPSAPQDPWLAPPARLFDEPSPPPPAPPPPVQEPQPSEKEP